jgi:ADP-ribose pyrophosphatase YjhB (NUDIX family)
MIEPWEIADSTWILRSGFMDIRRDRCRKPDGRRSRDYLALELKDFCVVVALTPSRELLLCREYKHGPRAVMHTLPAGFIEPGETPEEGARRELREETGHAAPAFVPLGAFLLVPDLTAARGHVFLARDVRAETTPHPDEDEEIEVATVPLDRATDYLEDASSLLAFHLARPHLA